MSEIRTDLALEAHEMCAENAKKEEKIINGSDYYMQNKSPVTAKNIIIQFAANYSLGDGSARQEVETVGSGSGYYITNGKCEKITWEKPARAEKTKYIGEDGNIYA